MKRDMYFPQHCAATYELKNDDTPFKILRKSSFVSDSSSNLEENTIISSSSYLSSSSNVSESQFGSDDVYPKGKELKKLRKRKTNILSTGGMAVGDLVGGRPGIIVDASGLVTNKFYKAKEKRAERKHDHRAFQNAASRSAATRAEFC